ncbi:hypothetical protein [Lewinella sp. IMCC34183]|uniref:hypothetical protein n=1 Tax=Lewinella sp. IMCC34183 TaxID=2248762 RepID=UPI001300ACC5|nr:hypothetical protein [Lewinella sp. IMCC34183]
MRPIPTALYICYLFLCTCAPDPAPSYQLPEGMEWGLEKGQPVGYVDNSNKYGGFRLDLTQDSARLYQPFLDHSEKYPAYAADSTARFPDSLYFTYQVEGDSSLHAVIRSPDGGRWEHRYAPVAKLESYPLPKTVAGRTYLLDLNDSPMLLRFPEERVGPNGKIMAADVVLLASLADRRAEFGTFGMSLLDPETGVLKAYYRIRPQDDGSLRHSILLVTGDGDGGAQAYQLLDDDTQRTVAGPFPLAPYASVVPSTVTEADLIDLLNRGRVEVEKVTAEPDSVGIRYEYEEPFRTSGGIVAEELASLDFEFREDNTYYAFAGDRLISTGRWKLSYDRNFITLYSPGYTGGGAKLIQRFGPDEIAFPFTVMIETAEPKGVELLSYYEAEVMLHFRDPAR